jgi:mono/diheme cytochrome c family protein
MLAKIASARRLCNQRLLQGATGLPVFRDLTSFRPMLPPHLIHHGFRRARIAGLSLTILACAAASTAHSQSAAGSDSAIAAAARQLDLGEQWYRSACAECHAVKALDNADFRHKWRGRSAFDLFSLIRTTMPDSRPGSLTPGTYVAILAYLLKLNGMPAGGQRLTSDSTALTALRLTFPAVPASTTR